VITQSASQAEVENEQYLFRQIKAPIPLLKAIYSGTPAIIIVVTSSNTAWPIFETF